MEVSSKRNNTENVLADFSASTFPRLLKIERSNACSFQVIRSGANSVIDVLNQMIKLVRQTSFTDTGFKNFVDAKILVANGLDSNSPDTDVFKAVYDFVYNNIKYISDEKGLEDIQDARTTLFLKHGDCDDQSILVASILSVLGYNSEFVIARTPRQERNNDIQPYKTVLPADYNHVYVSVPTPGHRYYLDTTLHNGQFDSQATTVHFPKAIKIWNTGQNPNLESFGDSGEITGAVTSVTNAIPVVGGILSTIEKLFGGLFKKPATDFTGLAQTTSTQLDTLYQTYLQNPTPDTYATMFHAGDDVMNNYIGLNNNRASDAQKQQNAPVLAALTAKLNQMKAQKPEVIAAAVAAATAAATDTPIPTPVSFTDPTTGTVKTATPVTNPTTGITTVTNPFTNAVTTIATPGILSNLSTSLGIDSNTLLIGGLVVGGFLAFYLIRK